MQPANAKQRGPRYFDTEAERSFTPSALRRASRETRIRVMKEWFYAHFANPVDGTPYNSAEGGYIYIWGGPYEPGEELANEFEGKVPDEDIEDLADELRDISWEWTGHPEFGDDFDFDVGAVTPLQTYETAFNKIRQLLLNKKISAEDKEVMSQLLYANVIAALEAFLADTFTANVLLYPEAKRRFIETTSSFQKTEMRMSNVYKVLDEIDTHIKDFCRKQVWHRLNDVRAMYKATLDVKLEDDLLSPLYAAIQTRHDLVHRNGRTHDGENIPIDEKQVDELLHCVTKVVHHVETQVVTYRLNQSSPAKLVVSDDLDF